MSGIGFSILLGCIGLVVGFSGANFRVNGAKKKANDLIDKANKEIEKAKRNAAVEQKEEAHKAKLELDKEIREKKSEMKTMEDRLMNRESNIDKRDELLQKRERALDDREEKLSARLSDIQKEKSKVEDIKKEQLDLLEKISGFSKDKARELVMSQVKENMNKEIAEYIHEREDEAKLEADKNARELIVSSMQRYASDIANEQTVTVVGLPNDEMKGRLIGREGRNIRSIEAVTGVDLIIDDTPEAVVLSSFDPLRREMARVTLETLIKDGRIHPTRIEEVYDKVTKDMKTKIIQFGQDAIFELGLTKFDSELLELVGKLHFRTSYGQNVLKHSIEVAQLTGIMAGEIGENIMLAKRAGLLHDIGKSIDFEIEGSHVDIGADLAKKYGEDDVVINTILSHHGDCEATSIIASLVQIADTISAARPGARNDSLENYIKRLQQLEEIANNFDGIEKSYAVQAGRELRVIVKPEEIDELSSVKLARDIKDKIEDTMQYPGTIKVIIIRETRVVEEAK